MTRASKPAQVCIVEIGYWGQLLLPLDKGLKVIELLQNAVECRSSYETGAQRYIAGAAPALELRSVKPDQVAMAEASSTAPRRPPAPPLLGNG